MKELVKVKQQFIGENYVLGTSAKDLYLGLGMDKSNWSKWYKKNIIPNKFFIENRDWLTLVQSTNGNETNEYIISIEFAKHLAMMADTDNAHEYRNYFISCEKELIAIKEERANFHKFRESARLDACDFMNAVYYNSERNLCGYRESHGAREFDLLNVIVLGMKASEFKYRNGLPSDLSSIRDNLTALQIEAIEYLQKADTVLLEMDDLNFNERHDRLKSMFDRKFGSRFVIENNKELLQLQA
jgi:anti-repressor protein